MRAMMGDVALFSIFYNVKTSLVRAIFYLMMRAWWANCYRVAPLPPLSLSYRATNNRACQEWNFTE